MNNFYDLNEADKDEPNANVATCPKTGKSVMVMVDTELNQVVHCNVCGGSHTLVRTNMTKERKAILE